MTMLRKFVLPVLVLTLLLAHTANAAALTSDLTLGSKGTEVSDLQSSLKGIGVFNDAISGYFGTLTQAAVKAFQGKASLAQTGITDSDTRSALNSYQAFSAASAATNVQGAFSTQFSRTLAVGSRGEDVTLLQTFLLQNRYMTATPSGYFGSQTMAGVKAFQSANGLESVGFVGPKTRTKLNTILGGGYAATTSVHPAPTTLAPSDTHPDAPTLSFSSDTSSVASGGTIVMNWNSTGATTCTASGAWSGARGLSGNERSGAISSDQTYTLRCSGAGGSVSRSFSVAPVVVTSTTPIPSTPSTPTTSVPPVAVTHGPTVTLSASASSVTSGQSATLTWTSSNATSCTASGGWSGTKSTQGSELAYPTTAKTYTLVCTGPAGTASHSVTVGVTAPVTTPTPVLAPTPVTAAPTVTFAASQSSITSGQSAVLSWSSSNATSCNASGHGWTTNQATSGSVTVQNLTSSQTYTLICTGTGGSTTKTATVSVTAASNPTTPTTPAPTPVPSTTGLPVLLKASGALTGPQNGTASITYNWTGVPMAADYYMFVHVLDANGGILFQNDTPIPSRTWSGPYSFTNSVNVPAGIPVGTYRLRAGIFSLANGYPKMPVTPGPGVTQTGGEEAYIIGTLTVTAGTNLPYSPPNDPSAYPGMPVQTSIPNAGDPITGSFSDDYHPSNMKLTFHDEFNGSSLNLNTWNEMYLWGDRFLSGNTEKECYLEENVRVAGGNLIFDAKKQDVICPKYNIVQPYTSGMVTTSKSFVQSYGYWAIRTKLPRGQGFWPAFWLLPNNAGWPPELDIFEVLDQDPTTIYTSIHTSSPTNPNIGLTLAAKVADLSSSYHVIAADWEPTYIIFYVDGVEVNRINQVFNSIPMYLVANLGVGGAWGGNPDATTPFPSTMDTDWIRVYK